MLEGALAIPSFWDHHGHVCQLGSIGENLDLRGCSHPNLLYRKVEKAAAGKEPGEWILGFGWDQNLWRGASPSMASLDAASPGNPVMLTRIDCHAALVNGRALRASGIGPRSKMDGGLLDGDAGLAVDNAMALVSAAVPPPTPAVIRRRISSALALLKRKKLSGVTDMWLNVDEAVVFEEMDAEGSLPVPVLAYLDWDLAKRKPGAGFRKGRMFRMAGAKVFIDGALGSRGAALSRSYVDMPASRGLLIRDADDIRDIIAEADARGIDLAFHAIGDRALSEFVKGCPQQGNRKISIRVEHLQVTPPALLAKLKARGVTASLQPSHLLSDRPWAGERLGKSLMRNSYLLRKPAEACVGLLLGTDFPIEPPDPLRTICACFTRGEKDRLPLARVLRAMECPQAFSPYARPLRVTNFRPDDLLEPERILSWKVRLA